MATRKGSATLPAPFFILYSISIVCRVPLLTSDREIYIIMTPRRSTNDRRLLRRVVAVIRSRADLDFAIRMRKPPDLLELRLDHLVGPAAAGLDELEEKISRLRAPLIITARHPQEGGANKLNLRQRRNLLSRFLPRARYIDVELRSAAAFHSLCKLAQKKNVQRILSFHDLKATPNLRGLQVKAHRAKSLGADIFKVATRTDTPAQLARLLDFITKKDPDLSVSAMGIGKLGAISRVLLAYRGSALVYGSVAAASEIEGQMSLEQLRAFGIGSRTRVF
jgi:3-dehydroquinate dehydratase I